MRTFFVWLLIFLLIGLFLGVNVSSAQDDTVVPISLNDFYAGMKRGEEFNKVRVECTEGEMLEFSRLAETDGNGNIVVDSENNIAIDEFVKIINSEIDCVVLSQPLAELSGAPKTVNFLKTVNFTNTVFSQDVILAHSEFKGIINFDNVVFLGGVSLDSSVINNRASFRGTEFRNETAEDAISLLQSFNLSGTIFEASVDFKKAKFYLPLYADGTQFHNTVTFAEAEFYEYDTVFLRVVFNTAVNPVVDFSGSKFEKRLGFYQTISNGSLLFRNATFEELLTFRGSQLNVLDLTNISMSGDQQLDLFDMSYSHLISNNFDFAWVLQEAEKFTLEDVRDVFARLETNFSEQDRPWLVNEAYYFKRTMECEFAGKWTAQSVVFDCLFSKPLGFLVHPMEVLFSSLLTFLLFSVIYFFLGAKLKVSTKQVVQLKIPSEIPANQTIIITGEIRPVNVESSVTTIWTVIQDAIALSFTAFISLKRVEADSKYKKLALPVTVIVTLEWLIGYYFLIGLVATLTKTIPILGQLVTQLR